MVFAIIYYIDNKLHNFVKDYQDCISIIVNDANLRVMCVLPFSIFGMTVLKTFLKIKFGQHNFYFPISSFFQPVEN